MKTFQTEKIPGEKTNFKVKISVSQTKVYEFSKEKFLIFAM